MSSGDKTIEEAIQGLRLGTGGDDNFRILFDRYCREVRRFFRRKGLSGEDAEDLTQEVFISVYKSIGGLLDPSQFEGWLFRIALNAFRNHLEHGQAKKREGVNVPLPDGYFEGEENEDRLPQGTPEQARYEDDPVQDLIDGERREAVHAAIATLPEQMRRCVLLRVTYDLTYVEIAPLMAISVNTVKAHLHQARKILAEKLESKLGET
jgi:RNA polymerase sigma-70 factor (ECF subfamily)